MAEQDKYRRLKRNWLDESFFPEDKIDQDEERPVKLSLFQALIEQSHDAFILINAAGRIILWNESAANLFEIDGERALKKYIWDIDCMLINPRCESVETRPFEKQAGPFREDFFDFLEKTNERNSKSREVVFYTKKNKKRIAEITFFSILTGEEKFVGRIARDITNKKKTENEILKYKNKLEQLVEERTAELEKEKLKAEESDNLKTAFLANISHEIRTPMNGILGFTNLLNQSNLNEEDRILYMKAIQDSTKQLLRVINDIIDASRIQSGQINFTYRQCQLRNVFTQAFEHQSQHVKQDQNLEFSIYSEDESLLTQKVKTDNDLLLQVLNQLVSNAIKFTNEGEITIGVVNPHESRIPENHLVFFVKDTGIGISQEMQQVIFQKFRQLDNTSTRLYRGMGLGLTISKELINIAGGMLWVESVKDKGSTFYFSFPVADVDEPQSSKQTFDINAIDLSALRILIVEDDRLNYIYLKEVLTPFNPDIVWVKNGEDAIEKVMGGSFDLVLMDIQLPRMSGYDATRKLRESGVKIPIIAQTANAMVDDVERCYEVGCTDYLSKPIQREDLLMKIHQCCLEKS
ncbi:MAG: response regulator [Bacteroidota bacterium]